MPLETPSALRIAPEDNVLIGAQCILRYLGISSITTLYDWIEDGALPCIKRPDGKWMTTMTAIDTWIFQAAGLVADKRREEIAARRTQKHENLRAIGIARRAGKGVGLIPGRRIPKSPYTSSMIERAKRKTAQAASLAPDNEVMLSGGTEIGITDADGKIISRRPATEMDKKLHRFRPSDANAS